MKVMLPRQRIQRGLIYVVSGLLVLIALDLLLTQWRREVKPGFDTTRIVSPRLPDGRIDYLKVLDDERAEGVTPENNAAVLLIQSAGRAALPANQTEDGITKQLGMAHVPEVGDYFISYEKFAKDFSKEQTAAPALPEIPTTFPAKIDSVTEKWIAANEHPLALFAQASLKSKFFIPFDGGNRPDTLESVLLPHVGILRQMSLALLLRATQRMESGDFAGFHDDLLTVDRWAGLMASAGTLVERSMARAILCEPVSELARAAAFGGKLAAAQARAMAADLGKTGELPPMSDAFNGERFMVLDILQAMAKLPPDRAAKVFNDLIQDGTIHSTLIRFLPIPYEQDMQQLNSCYDGALAAMRLPTYKQRAAAIQLWDDENAYLTSGNRYLSVFHSDFVIRTLMFSISGVERRQDSATTERHLTLVALALAAYKSDHGKYPATLADLAPLPDDLYSDEPFVYAVKDQGYLLRSVGPNMSDDGGAGDDITANVP